MVRKSRTGGRWRSGDLIMRTTTTDVRQTRTGIRTRIVPQTVRQSLGDRVVSVGFVPFH